MRKFDSESYYLFVLVIAPTTVRIKETLLKRFADVANNFEHQLHTISLELTAIEGPLEVIIFYLAAHTLTFHMPF
jgi:hypothetical protein